MEKLSKKKKERIAVSVIDQKTFDMTSHLETDIPTDDKKPSFDGEITVYKDETDNADSYINDVPTQVKGTEVEEFTDDIKKFSLEMVHYNNFYRKGGCLLLVVEILNPTSTKIFYKQLLPTELKEIIENHGHQWEYTTELRPLEETNLYDVCLKFVEQMEKQSKPLIENNIYNVDDYDEHIFTSLTFDPVKDSIQDVLKHDFIHYGIKDNIQYPIKNIRFNEFGILEHDQIDVSGKKFNVKVETKHAQNKLIKTVEDCVELAFDKNKQKGKFTFKIKKNSSLSKQLKALPVLNEFLEVGEIKFIDFNCEVNIRDYKSGRDKQDFRELYLLLLDLREIFNELNIDPEVHFGDKNNIIGQIEKLVKIMKEQDYSKVKITNPDKPSFFEFMIGDIYILLFHDPNSDNKIIDAFSEQLTEIPFEVYSDDQNNTAKISPYILLGERPLVNAENLNIDFIIRSLDLIEFDQYQLVFTPINNFSLFCLNAYDETNNDDILRLPLYLYKELLKIMPESAEKDIATINLYQTNYRYYGKFTNDEYKQLTKIKEQAIFMEESEEVKFCINILLGSEKEATFSYENMEPEMKEYYKTLPIFNLYKKML